MGRNSVEIPYLDAPEELRSEVRDLGELAERGYFFVEFGFDAPCGGYFVQIGWDMEDSNLEEIVTEHSRYNGCYFEIEDLGFMPGVPKNVVLQAMEKWKVLYWVKTCCFDAFSLLCLDLPC